jgi:predicted amidophosphoribosyltransferase
MKWFEDERTNAPKRKVCANCMQEYIEGDRYCRFCGAPMGKPEFIDDDFACIYGPMPTERLHQCQKCGYQWKTVLMIDKERWCPKCGGFAPVSGEQNIWNLID